MQNNDRSTVANPSAETLALSSPQPPDQPQPLTNPHRRKFLGQMGQMSAALAVGSLAAPQLAAAEAKPQVTGNPGGNARAAEAFAVRLAAATAEATIPIPSHQTNGDAQRYPDGSANYTKCVLQDGIDRVNPNAYALYLKAAASGSPEDWANVPMGGTRTLNGPQGAYAYTLVGTDAQQLGSSPSLANQEPEVVVPAPPPIASAQAGTEMIEHYWGALLRDTAFIDYPTSPLAAAACAELTAQPTYTGPRNQYGQVTPNLLFRGGNPGETIGPYMSQLITTPTTFGALPLPMQFITYLPGINYMMDPFTYQQVQNGISTGLLDQTDPTPRYLHNGRGLGGYTHVDVLYEAFFLAYLTLSSLNVPLNPGNPYVVGSFNQNGFGTFGGPDFAASVADVSVRALNATWFQKWVVHNRNRPEVGGALVYLAKTGQANSVQARVNQNLLNSQAVKQTYETFDTWFLPQAFPEGSPAHPAYPTGHGTVAGACITVLKFFYDGAYVIPNPTQPSDDGLSLLPYTGADAGQITVNGELNKLAHNISFGHGIHAGIHWRSDTDISIQVGEAFAISYLQDKARTYNEKFTINITKIDGTIATISNQ